MADEYKGIYKKMTFGKDEEEFEVPFADDAEIPGTWLCRNGLEGTLIEGDLPEPKKVKPPRTHWDMLLERRSVEELEEQGATSYVLDLRNNPGGYLNQAVSVASLFINSGNVVQIQTKNGTSVKAVSGTTATVRPVVVLVNQNTAASAEVLAAAFKETQRGTIVGQTTLGKGSVQVVRELSFGGALRYTAAYYLTAQGRTIDKTGVNPDIAVYNGDSGDAQLDYAREYASVLASE